MKALILGCGALGTLAGTLLKQNGNDVLGVRRTPEGPSGFKIVSGDISDRSFYATVGKDWDAVLLSANPALRRGRDNGLREAAALINEFFPTARLVYSGTTSVYGDNKGEGVNENGPMLDDPAAAALRTIEETVLEHPHGIVLRASAIVGKNRIVLRERLRRGDWVFHGQLDRPFSYIHELDQAELCLDGLLGRLPNGVLNAASPDRLTAADYYRAVAREAGLTVELKTDGETVPSRWIDATRLWRLYPGRRWRHFSE